MSPHRPLAATAAAALFLALGPAALAQNATSRGQTPAVANADAQQFVLAAASSDEFEIASSKTALQRSGSADVKAFAQKLIDDHTASSAKLAGIAKSQGLTVPPVPQQRQAQLLKEIDAAKGGDFDTRFLEVQTTAHQEAVSLASDYAADGENEALKAFAAEALPMLQQHLDAAEALADAR